MNYLIHVIDNASQFKKNNDKFEIVQSFDQKIGQCQVLASDAFYYIKAENIEDAVAKIAFIIKAQKNNESITLAQALMDTKKSISISDFDSNRPDSILSDLNVVKMNNPYSKHFTVSCHIEKEINGEQIIELHRVEFFFVEEDKIMEVI